MLINNLYQVIYFYGPSGQKSSCLVRANSAEEAIDKVFDTFFDDRFYSLVDWKLISDRSDIDQSLLPC